MAGKWIIAILIASSLAAAYVMYGAFKKSPDYRHLVTEQMRMEFFDYSTTIKNVSKLTLATDKGVEYYVDIDPKLSHLWKFEIHDKTLVVEVPILRTKPEIPEMSAASVKLAQKTLEDFIAAWLEDKFHTKKDLLVQVQFKNLGPQVNQQ